MNAAVPSRPTVLDATVLSNFAYLEQVATLQVLSSPITVPAVRDEIAAGAQDYTVLTNALDALDESIPVVGLDDETRSLAETLSDRLDQGEAESLAVAETHHGLLVTDDGAARSLARDRGVHLTGSIGVLIELVDRDRIDEPTADAWLKRLIDETDYRAPSRDLAAYRYLPHSELGFIVPRPGPGAFRSCVHSRCDSQTSEPCSRASTPAVRPSLPSGMRPTTRSEIR